LSRWTQWHCIKIPYNPTRYPWKAEDTFNWNLPHCHMQECKELLWLSVVGEGPFIHRHWPFVWSSYFALQQLQQSSKTRVFPSKDILSIQGGCTY
jgi:hypothetical protein